jgi:hypothetical protein
VRQFQKAMQSSVIRVLIFMCVAQPAAAWNPPAHIVIAAIAYGALLEQPDQRVILGALRPLLHAGSLDPDAWLQRQTQKLSAREADEVRFILTAAWADLVRKVDPAQHRDRWHYINWPFKPAGEPARVVARPPQAENILTALAHNQGALQSAAAMEQRAVAFAWILHLVGDVHQPLHTAQLFTRQYPEGDRGGNEICVRMTASSVPVNLHLLWDGWLTSNSDTRTLISMAAELRRKLPKPRLADLAGGQPKAWAGESYELAKKAAYLAGSLRGTPKGRYRDCSEMSQAMVLPTGYVAKAKEAAERRIVLAGYRLAGLLATVCRQSNCARAAAAGAR